MFETWSRPTNPSTRSYQAENKRDYRCGKINKHPLNSEHHPAGRSQHHDTEVDDLEQDDAQDRLYPARADDIRLGKANLFNPCADVKGVRETDKDINDCQINRGSRCEMPRKHSQGKDGHAIRRKSDGVVAKPSAAI